MADPVFNTDLIDDLAREKVVLFLGAGVSASAITASGARIAGWSRFLERMCALTEEPIRTQAKALIDKKDFLLACEIIQSALEETWFRELTAEFGQRAEPSELHVAIIELRQRFILTTNFDKLLETFCDSLDTMATHYHKVISSIDEDVFRVLKDHSGRYIIKIHGSIDNAKTLVFSRSEYIQLAFGNINYSTFLENILLNYTLLFIGFSMEDPAIISLMEMYALRYKTARPHYILTATDVEENIAYIFKKLRKLVFIKYDGSENHRKLPETIRSLGRCAIKRRREIYASSQSKGDIEGLAK